MFSCGAAMLEAGKEIKAAYYRVLMALYGEIPGFEYSPAQEADQGRAVGHHGDMVMEWRALRPGGARSEILWRGGSRGRQPGRGP